MPRQRFLGQRLVDFLVAHGYELCSGPAGPPAGLTVLSLNCADADSQIHLVAHSVEQGAPYAEKLLGVMGIPCDEFWGYLDST